MFTRRAAIQVIVLLAVAIAGLSAWPRSASCGEIKAGTVVVTKERVEAKVGTEVKCALDPGVVLVAARVQGEWVWVKDYEHEKALGWIWGKSLLPVEAVIANLSARIERNPETASLFFDRGLSYAFQADYKRAIADFDAVLHLDPDDQTAKSFRENAVLLRKVKARYDYQVKQQAGRAVIPSDVLMQMHRLYHWNPNIRLDAIEKLQAMGKQAAVALPCLLPLRDDWSQAVSEWQVVTESNADQLGVINPSLIGAAVRQTTTIAFAARGAISAIGEHVVESLIADLSRKDEQVRKDAIEVLSEVLGTTGEDLGQDPAKWRRRWEEVRSQRESLTNDSP